MPNENTRRVCGNCRWWLPDNPDSAMLSVGGTCHGGPPTAIIVMQKNAITEEISQGLSSAWPPVARNELPCAMHAFPLTNKKEPT